MAGPKKRKKLKSRRQEATIAKVVAEAPNVAGGKFLKKSGKLPDTKSKKDEREKRSRMRHRQRGIK